MSVPKPPRVVGHRGAATYAPENTLASLREARRRGATWVEFDVKLSAAGSGRELSQRLAKIETAISRRKTVEFSYYSLQRDEVSDRKVDPYHLVFRSGQFYLIAHAHERDQVRAVDRAPAVLSGLDQLERHGQPGGS